MKKFLILGLIISLLIFFTLPTSVFAEPGDDSTAEGPDDGQYEMDPVDDDSGDLQGYSDPPEEVPGSEIDEMEVYCIDEDIDLDSGYGDYEETDTSVSEELIENGADEDEAVAVEIMSTNATGATDEENQNVVWDILTSSTGDERDITLDESGEAVKEAVLSLSEEFNSLTENNDEDPGNDITLEDFLESKGISGINDITVELDKETEFIEEDGTCNDEFEATVIMDEPLVPKVTDGVSEDEADFSALDGIDDSENLQGAEPEEITATGAKTVFWYILEGSYNVSFSPDDLVTETTSGMFDYTDDGTDPDGDGDNSTEDHYGMATTPYYFYWWGDGFPEFEEMSVNIGAAVDIDEDEMIDKEKGQDLDDFKEEFEVVQTTGNPDYDDSEDPGPYNSPHEVEKNEETNTPEVVTDMPENVDIDYYNAGKTVMTKQNPYLYGLLGDGQPSSYNDVWIPGHYTDRYWSWGRWRYTGWVSGHWVNGAPEITIPEGWYVFWGFKYWKNAEIVHPKPYDQRFVIESYSEPTDTASYTYQRWMEFELTKTDSIYPDKTVGGATYNLLYDYGRDDSNSYPYQTSFSEVTGPDGVAKFTNLPWGVYVLSETEAPEDYELDTSTYNVFIGGSCLMQMLSETPEDFDSSNGTIEVEDVPEPGIIEITKSVLDPLDQETVDEWGTFGLTIEGIEGYSEPFIIEDGETITITDLLPGDYTIEEDTIPEGYIFVSIDGGTENPATVQVESNETTTVKIVNKQEYGSVNISKDVTDPDDNPITDTSVSFPITFDGTPDNISDEETISHTDIVIPGEYTVEEGALPFGYDFVSITSDNTVTNGASSQGVTFEVLPGGTTDVDIVNKQQYGEIKVHKEVLDPSSSDIEDTSNGFGLEITGGNGNTSYAIATMIYDEDILDYTNLVPGEFKVSETTIPSGYSFVSIDSDTDDTNGMQSVEFSLNPGETVHVYITNEQDPGEIVVTKTDEVDGTLLADTVFSLLDSEGKPVTDIFGNTIGNVTTDANGAATFSDLFWGEYIIREVTAPEGYDLAGDVIVIVEGGESEPVGIADVSDSRIPGTITIFKYAGASPLGGVEFDITNGDDFAAKMVTGPDGVASISGLPWDTYYILEVSAPDGYTVNTTQFVITISRFNLSEGIDVENGVIVTGTAGTPPVEVAGITEGGIEVLGISEELPFTGMNMYIPISGLGAIIVGLVLLLVSIRKKKIQADK